MQSTLDETVIASVPVVTRASRFRFVLFLSAFFLNRLAKPFMVRVWTGREGFRAAPTDFGNEAWSVAGDERWLV